MHFWSLARSPESGKKTSSEKNNFLSSQFPPRWTSARGGVGGLVDILRDVPGDVWGCHSTSTSMFSGTASRCLRECLENAFENAFATTLESFEQTRSRSSNDSRTEVNPLQFIDNFKKNAYLEDERPLGHTLEFVF